MPSNKPIITIRVENREIINKINEMAEVFDLSQNKFLVRLINNYIKRNYTRIMKIKEKRKIGIARLELATSRPPRRALYQLSHIPIYIL